MGYTAQFGNGFSATIAAEAPRKTQIMPTDALVTGAVPALRLARVPRWSYGGFQAPDVVGQPARRPGLGLGPDHGRPASGQCVYYTTALATSIPGHPDDKLGFVIGAGIKLNAPMIGQGDYLQAQVNYTQGALRYVFQTPNSNWGKVDRAGRRLRCAERRSLRRLCSLAQTATDLELTTAWNVNAAYEHFWNPRWRTSLYGGYAAVSYNGRGNAIPCGG